ncbi:MAG: hypoxanthine phosphoribosyltransferase [Verrucomicrobiia bacterium]
MKLPGRSLISAARIARRVRALAAEIEGYYGSEPVTVVGLMNGSIFFLVDLVRQLRPTVRIECWAVSSYEGASSTGKLAGLPALGERLRGERVLIVDDILDTGLTLSKVQGHLRAAGAKEVRICVLLRKEVKRCVECEADWVGFDIGNEYVVGYGLDLDGAYRALPMIRAMAV